MQSGTFCNRTKIMKGMGIKMKGLKPLVIMGMITLFAVAWYSLFNNSQIIEDEYITYREEARNKAQMGIITDASNNYDSALAMHENIDLRCEIADYYLSSGQMDSFVEACVTMISKYPKEEIGYNKLLEYYYKNESFSDCFTVIDKVGKRGIRSKVVDQISNDIYYTYKTKSLKIKDVGANSGGFIAIQNEDGKWGYYSERGYTSVGCNYKQIAPFTSDGYACVFNQEDDFYLINTKNEKKYIDIELKNIEECFALSNGLMAAKIDGRFSYLNINFKVEYGDYDDAGSFHDGVAAVKNSDGWFVINADNVKMTNTYYADIKLDEAQMAFHNNLAFVSDNGSNYYLIDIYGKKVGTSIWDDALPFRTDKQTAVKKDGKWGFIDTSGNVVVEPKYEDARPFSNGMAAVKIDGAWGYIDSKNYELVIPAIFEQAREMSAFGFAFVQEKGEWYVLSLYRLNH